MRTPARAARGRDDLSGVLVDLTADEAGFFLVADFLMVTMILWNNKRLDQDLPNPARAHYIDNLRDCPPFHSSRLRDAHLQDLGCGASRWGSSRS